VPDVSTSDGGLDGTRARRALVTGGTGFLGTRIAARLLNAGWHVDCVTRPIPEEAPAGTTAHLHDGTTERMIAIVAAARPDVVFHLAGLFVATHAPADVEPLIASNVLFGAQVLEGMSAAGGGRFINTSTCWQHYLDAPYRPVDLYAATKQAFEDIVDYHADATGVQAVTITIYDTYGPGDTRGKLLEKLVRAALDGAPMGLSPGEQQLELVHVDDVVEAYVAAADLLLADAVSGHERYALRARERVTVRELAAVVERAAGRAIDADWGARPYRDREMMEPWSAGVPVPGWAPAVSLEDGVRQVVEQERGR
jgi:nucleoside-diphosphate-sugar epimerase